MQVTSCDVCQRSSRKIDTVSPELHPIPVVSPWYHVGIDFIGPVSPASTMGNKYILTVADYFTKFVDATALPTKEADGVATTLFKVLFCNIVITCMYIYACVWLVHKISTQHCICLYVPFTLVHSCSCEWEFQEC